MNNLIQEVVGINRSLQRTAVTETPAAGGGGAPTNASYVVLGLNGTLTDERVLTGTANQVIIADNGAGSTVVLSLPQDIDTGADVIFNSVTLAAGSMAGLHISDLHIYRDAANHLTTSGGSRWEDGIQVGSGASGVTSLTRPSAASTVLSGANSANAHNVSITSQAATTFAAGRLTSLVSGAVSFTETLSIEDTVPFAYYQLQTGANTPIHYRIGPSTGNELVAVLELTTTERGVLLPRMTTTQRDALSTATGLLIYNTTTNAFNYYNGSSWAAVGGGSVDGGGAATQVTYWVDGDTVTGSANMTFDGDRLSLATTGATGGISIGGDTEFYRSAANVIFTPDSLVVDSLYFDATSGPAITNSGYALGISTDGGGASHGSITLSATTALAAVGTASVILSVQHQSVAVTASLTVSATATGAETATFSSFDVVTVSVSNAATTPAFEIAQGSTGDAALRFSLGSTASWIVGIDNSDSDKWKLSYAGSGSAAFGTNDALIVTSSQWLGVGGISPGAVFHIARPDSGAGMLFDKYTNDGAGAFFWIRKSRGTTLGAHTIVQDGDTISEIAFWGSDGTDFRTNANIAAKVDGTPGANNIPTMLEFATAATGGGTFNATARLRIRADGSLEHLGSSTTTIGFRGATPVAAQTYTVTNGVIDRSYNANSTTVAELADILYTLLQDLDDMGIVVRA